MSILLQALFLFASQTSSPFDRAEALLKGSNGFTAAVRVSVDHLGSGTGMYSLRRPSLQKFTLQSPGLDETFLEGKGATVHINNVDKEFTWYPAFPISVEAPEEASTLMRVTLPLLLARGSLKQMGTKDHWKELGQEDVDSHSCDILSLSTGSGPADQDQARLWIDATGRILRTRLLADSPRGPVVCTVEFINPTYSAPAESAFDVKIPLGYVPSKPPEPRTARSTNERIKLGKWAKLPGLEPVQMDGKEPILVLVTSDDLVPEGDLSRWKGLSERAKKAKVKFVQMWIGKKPSPVTTEWDSFWDQDSAFENDFGTPATPYLYMIVDNVVISAWQGWTSGDDAEAARTLFSPLSRRTSR